MGRASLRAMPLAHLKAYLNAYGLRAPPHAVEKEDYVRAVLDARANEDYYRRHSIPQPTGERPKGFLARMAESFSDFVDSLPQPELSTHVHPPPVPPRHTAPRPPPPPPPRPQAAPSPSNARPTPQQPQHNPPPHHPQHRGQPPKRGAARVAKEREARLKAAEEEAELEAQRQALEEIDRRKKASVQKDDAGTSEERESQVDAPVGLPKAAAHAATKLERDGLCVICQDEDANIAIVDCGPAITASFCQADNFNPPHPERFGSQNVQHRTYNQLEYQPFQVAPPLNSSNLAQPPIQQPNPVAQQQLQSQLLPRSFTQHAATFAKFNEASEQQLALAAKVETLQATTNSLQQTVNAILENIQQVSDRGAPNRRASNPPKSDELRARSGPQSLTGDVLEPQGQQLHSLRDLIRDASPLENDGISAPGPDSNNISRLSTTPRISSDQPIAQPDAEFTISLVQQSTKVAKTPGRAKSRKSDASSQTTLKATRRSARKVKRRQRDDGTTEIPVLKKKIKLVPKTEEGVSGKAPRKSGRLEFNWKNVPIQEAELEQLIYCDKCDRAYHWGCVNILPEDPILQQEADWLCPPCEFGAQHGTTSGHTYDPNTKCRPDCPAQDNEDVMFAIDAIIGRFPHSADLSGAMMQYLVKWEDVIYCATIYLDPENEIGQAAHALIRDFETAALKENLEVNDRSQLILLKEARDGGWGYYTFPS
ncbi:Chromatin organization modifier domain [Rhizoctonia solani]|uniref:Chromatin organization modifier domain n=1 Tax=Rhizoctonia solani TaxID=456999 RepID=A0A8H7IME4_9AGAM|nr:Chromatin organization modifier domain [Rhizoctonia solani]